MQVKFVRRLFFFFFHVFEGQSSEAQTESQSGMSFRILTQGAGFISHTVPICIKCSLISPWV